MCICAFFWTHTKLRFVNASVFCYSWKQVHKNVFDNCCMHVPMFISRLIFKTAEWKKLHREKRYLFTLECKKEKHRQKQESSYHLTIYVNFVTYIFPVNVNKVRSTGWHADSKCFSMELKTRKGVLIPALLILDILPINWLRNYQKH